MYKASLVLIGENLDIPFEEFYRLLSLIWSKIIYNMMIQIRVRVSRALNDKFYLKKSKITNVKNIKRAIAIISKTKQYLKRDNIFNHVGNIIY